MRFVIPAFTVFIAAILSTENLAAEKPVDIGSRLELFVDDFLISELKGDAHQFVHQPEPREVVLVTGEPWEGNTCAYYTIFRDGDVYRMYYRGSHGDVKTGKTQHSEVTCYAESRDGIHFTKPKLGLVEWDGSKENNIILNGLGTHCFVAFRDENPNCKSEARYKGISRGRPVGKAGLYVFHSPDGIHWSLTKNEPVITDGYFDSQNLAFWDPVEKQYIDYHRTFTNKVRSIMTCRSDDFVNWTKPVLLKYPEGTPNQHLYTNAIRPYERATHLKIGFPTRYRPSDSQVEPIFMSSRDGLNFHRWNKAVIPPDAPKERDGNRSNYMANALVSLAGNERELAVYGSEAYYEGPDSRLRRFTYRVDGFVSVQAGAEGGELVTKPLTFQGEQIVLNFATKKGGRVKVELQDENGQPIPGFELSSCQSLTGDSIEQTVSWKTSDSVAKLSGKTIRIRFVIQNGDVYSLRFRHLI
ncbi:MAG: hypothetical protein HQ518_05520 [Rhodopirellula sp.]|nr:hypothetical protein [Rhodopirellula sp.]